MVDPAIPPTPSPSLLTQGGFQPGASPPIPVPETGHMLREDFLKLVMSWLAVFLVLIAAVVAFGYLIFVGISQDVWLVLAREQFPLVIGLPGSAAIALFVVLVLRISSGPINIEFGKMKFEGAAAPIVFWLFCFLALATMVKLLWIS
jgi:hypothetical protein